jgi:hypothetical protein
MNALKKNNATNIRHAPPICGSGSRSRRGQSACKCHASQHPQRENTDFKTKCENSGRKFGLFAGREASGGVGVSDRKTCPYQQLPLPIDCAVRPLLRNNSAPPEPTPARQNFFGCQFPRLLHRQPVRKTIFGLRGKCGTEPVSEHGRK